MTEDEMNNSDTKFNDALCNYKIAKLAISMSLTKLPHYDNVIKNFEDYLQIRLLICKHDYRREIFETRQKILQSK